MKHKITRPEISPDVQMAWRNVWRNPRRTWLTVSAICFACIVLIFMLSFQFGSYETMINSSVKINTGHLQVQAEGYFEKRTMRRVIPDPGPVIKMIKGIEAVEAVTVRANAFSLVSSAGRTYGAMVIGIDPEREKDVSTLADLIRKGNFLPSEPVSVDVPGELSGESLEESSGALVGALLARNLNVGVGDELTLLGQGRDGSVAATIGRVCGIYESGIDEFDRNTLQIPIQIFQSVYSMDDAVHEIVINVRSLHEVAAVKQEIIRRITAMPEAEDLVVMDWDELMPGLTQAILIDLTMGIIFWFLLVLVVAFSILNTFLMAVFERTREFGVMMAIGMSPNRLVKLLVYESGLMTLIGIGLGILIGCGITWIFQAYGIDMARSSEILAQYGISGRIYPQLSLITAFAGPLLVWMITIAVALYPAMKIRRLKPVEAMTHV